MKTTLLRDFLAASSIPFVIASSPDTQGTRLFTNKAFKELKNPGSLAWQKIYEEDQERWVGTASQNTDSSCECHGRERDTVVYSGTEALPGITDFSKLCFVVDDVDEQSLSSLISKRWSVKTFSDGDQALAACYATRPDLVIADLSYLNMLQQLKESGLFRDVPVIMLCESGACRVSGLEFGADDVLDKPVNGKELLMRANQQLDFAAIRQKLQDDIVYEQDQRVRTARRFEQIARITPCGILMASGEINDTATFANDRFLQMMAISRESWESDISYRSVNFYVSELIHPDDRPGAFAAYMDCLRTHSPFSRQYRLNPWGRTDCIWVQHDCVFEIDDDGFVGHVHCFVDITSRVVSEMGRLEYMQRAEEMQRRRADEAEEAKKHQEGFVDMVCHEIRNPLNGVLNNNAFIEDAIVEAKESISKQYDAKQIVDIAARMISKIEEATLAISMCGKHQKSVVDDVLNMSKLNMNLMTISTATPFFPHETIRDLLLPFNAEMKRKKISLSMNVGDRYRRECAGRTFFGDPARLGQVLINLMSNASKFVAGVPNATIVASIELEDLTETGARLHFEVRDNGIGMTAEEISNLFQQFKQANTKTYAQYGGSGLGLFISKKLIELMGGTIGVESSKGHGCAFMFHTRFAVSDYIDPEHSLIENPVEEAMDEQASLYSLPRRTAAVPPSDPEPAKDFPGAPRVLVVDDNEINRKVLIKHLVKLGYNIDEAGNGREALVRMGDGGNNLALVLMDVEMPLLDGLEATRLYRRVERLDGAPLPIVAVTGNARSEHVRASLDSGMQDVLLKPITRDGLAKMLEKHVRREIGQ